VYPKKVFHRTPAPGVEVPPAKKQQSDNTEGGKSDGDKPKGDQQNSDTPTPGLLIWKGSSHAPIPDIQFEHPISNKPRKLIGLQEW
jgi:hypothetical protein